VTPVDITKTDIVKAREEAEAKKKAKAEAEQKTKEEAAARARIAETEKKAAERDRAWDEQMKRTMGGICKGC
jgi:membrane protein involved in colicin uptake